MCNCCCRSRPTGLSIAQDRVLWHIRSTWDGVCVYDTDNEGLVLIVGHNGSEYHFSLVAQNGERQRVTDPLNQSHWLSDIHSGRRSLLWSEYPAVTSPGEVDSYHPSRGDYLND